MKLLGKEVGLDQRIFFIAGPCVIETPETAMRTADCIARMATKLNVLIIYKSSYYKANRTSGSSFRGPGIEKGLEILKRVSDTFGIPVTTDVHSINDIAAAKDSIDLIQIPALLSRQTDIIEAASRANRPVNIKKGQFMSPEETIFLIEKARAAAKSSGQSEDKFLISERGTAFGYRNLISDMRSLEVMRITRCPVIFDASHSAQEPGALGIESGGQQKHIPLLARAAVATGVAGIFIETHPSPLEARCDRLTQWPLCKLEDLVLELIRLDEFVKERQMHLA